ncbi:MAG: NAD(P)-binding protein [Candidatus Hermodarchaeota archaeon]
MPQEVTIIGGNISGLGAAYYLAQKGFYVTVYEAKIWNKPCGGAISLEFEKYLREELNIELEESDHYTERFKVGLWTGRYMEDIGIFRITTRYDLQQKLISQVKEIPNIDVKLKRVSTKDKSLFTPQTIVATGYSGFANKVMDRRWRSQEKALTLRYDGEFKGCSYPNTNLIVLDHEKMGYGWVFVGKNDHLNIGVGAIASKDYVWKKYCELFNLIKNKYSYDINQPSTKPQAWILPLLVNKKNYPVSNNKGGIEFIGVGDVLGLAHPLSGAGIEPAWQSSWVLAECTENDRINTEKYKSLLIKNLRLSSWRKLDHYTSLISRKRIPFKSTLGFFALHLIRYRLLKMMRNYHWFSLVHDGEKETGFKIAL